MHSSMRELTKGCGGAYLVITLIMISRSVFHPLVSSRSQCGAVSAGVKYSMLRRQNSISLVITQCQRGSNTQGVHAVAMFDVL
jgi:hypothetical protein